MKEQFLIHKLYEIGAVKFGEFTLKSGTVSPIYIDLRHTISTPKLLVMIAELMHEKARSLKYDLVCGVPYTALPIATALSIQHTVPMVLCRKERKEYGTKKQIEGVFEPNMRCLLLEDVITSGQSIFQTIHPLEEVGLQVEDIIVLVDREQGGCASVEGKGYKVHPILTIGKIIDLLQKEDKITEEMHIAVKDFIRNHQVHE